MTVKYPLLARPTQVGALEAKNAVFMASLTRNRAGCESLWDPRQAVVVGNEGYKTPH